MVERIEQRYCDCGRPYINPALRRRWQKLEQDGGAAALLREEAEERACVCVPAIGNAIHTVLASGHLAAVAQPLRTPIHRSYWNAHKPEDIISHELAHVACVPSAVYAIWQTNRAAAVSLPRVSDRDLDRFLLRERPGSKAAYKLAVAAFPLATVTKRHVAARCKELFPDRSPGRPLKSPKAAKVV